MSRALPLAVDGMKQACHMQDEATGKIFSVSPRARRHLLLSGTSRWRGQLSTIGCTLREYAEGIWVFFLCEDGRIVDHLCRLEVHPSIPIRRHGWVPRPSLSFKGGQCQLIQFGIEWVFEQFWICRWGYIYSLREVRFVLSLDDDGESNVLEVIQNLELLLDLRETSWITFCVLDWNGGYWT